MKLLISPHPDDAALFAAFTILAERPEVVTVFDGGDPVRRAEDEAAMAILGARVTFLGLPDKPDVSMAAVESALRGLLPQNPEIVYAPAAETGGHPHHNKIGEIAAGMFSRVRFYATYTRIGGKSEGRPVHIEPWMVERKLRALACYQSQMALDEQFNHFLREQFEYLQ